MSRTDAVTSERKLLLREAAQWLTRLDRGELSETERLALEIWSQTSPEHQRIWQAACDLNDQFAQVPDQLAKPVLNRQRTDRRTLLKSLVGLGLLAPLGWSIGRHQPWQSWLADYRTATGQQQTLSLNDGSQLLLNTHSAVDINFNAQQRIIRLYEGEIFIRTGKDPRPLSVETRHGSVRALGTAFSVRDHDHSSRVIVTEDAVQITPIAGQRSEPVQQGQQCQFSTHQVSTITPASQHSQSWQQGELIVDNWRLADFVEELSRYRPGTLRCTENAANLRISGVFQTENTDQALEVLEQAFNLEITRYTDFWIQISAPEK